MIPVLGVPILVGPDLLWELMDAIDTYEIGEKIIIDNGTVIEEEEAYRRGITLVRPGCNLGVAGSWNHIIKMRPKARWWAIFNFDLIPGPGDLERLEEHMDTVGGVAMLSSFSAFALDRDAVQRAGMFDESFSPAYFEDNDFARRCELAGVSVVGLPSGAMHRNSSTLSLSQEAREGNHRTFSENRDLYVSKWGGLPHREVYTTPFDRGGSIKEWHLDIERLAKQSWF